MTLTSIAIFLAFFWMTYLASSIRATAVRIILIPTGMIGMIASAVLFFISIIILIL